MKVIALDPVPRGVRLVVFVGELGKANSPKVMLYVTYEFNEDEARPAGLAQIRTRLRTLFEKEKPDKVFVEPLEGHALRGANKRNVNIGWFESAESRGVAAETAHSANCNVSFRNRAEVTRSMGDRKGAEYAEDDAFWADEVEGFLPKAYREAALMAISFLRAGK